jgi:Mn-dependent DtxR family transcriptional regulator
MRYIFIFKEKYKGSLLSGLKTLKWHYQKKIILKASIISRWFLNSKCTNAIAEMMDTKASSVTDMLKKLAEKIWWII